MDLIPIVIMQTWFIEMCGLLWLMAVIKGLYSHTHPLHFHGCITNSPKNSIQKDPLQTQSVTWLTQLKRLCWSHRPLVFHHGKSSPRLIDESGLDESGHADRAGRGKAVVRMFPLTLTRMSAHSALSMKLHDKNMLACMIKLFPKDWLYNLPCDMVTDFNCLSQQQTSSPVIWSLVSPPLTSYTLQLCWFVPVSS